MRRSIPHKTEIKLLAKNRHTCCICGRDGLFKEIIIHHIDGNPSNNVLANLAVLCLNHASMADASLKKGKLGTGKKLKPDEVRIYKKQWEKKTEVELNSPKRYLPLKERRQLELLYKGSSGDGVSTKPWPVPDLNPGVSLEILCTGGTLQRLLAGTPQRLQYAPSLDRPRPIDR